MKRLFIGILFICCVINSSSQTYSAIGYAGKDTLHLGTTVIENGNLNLNLGDYNGFIELTPVSAQYKDIALHLELVNEINSEASFNTAKAYINDTLSFNELYHSGMWKEYIQYWVGFYLQPSKNADDFTTTFLPVAKQVINRTTSENPQISVKLIQNLIEFFEQFGIQKAAEEIAAFSFGLDIKELANSEIISRLLTASKLTGKSAPELVGLSSPMKGKTSLLIFYETGCGHCDQIIEELTRDYDKYQSKDIRIITISADTDQRIFDFYAEKYPWADKLCDFKGFAGENFQNYGINGTPTIFVVDTKGNIKGQYGLLSDTGLLE